MTIRPIFVDFDKKKFVLNSMKNDIYQK